MIKVHPFGDYAHRQPFAYIPIREGCADAILVTNFAEADIVVLSHTKDLERYADTLIAQLGAGQRLVLLSEEPFWDSIWARDPLTREQSIETRSGSLPFVFLNHVTSDIFDFERIPYFILTDYAYAIRYACWFRENAQLSVADWMSRFAAVDWDLAFVAEYRNEPLFDKAFPEAGLIGLGRWRTRLALGCNDGKVLRMGAGWNALPRRQSLPDWHLEKYLDLNGRCAVLSAVENTYHPQYITEKVFDSLCIGAIPLYVAGPSHRLYDLLPNEAFIDLHGLTPDDAAALVTTVRPDQARVLAFREGQQRMAQMFNSPSILRAEYDRLCRALTCNLEALL
jgi:hypothetical protein